jgi:hypothetical protein
MIVYDVTLHDYFDQLMRDDLRIRSLIARCERPMKELIARYGLAGKKILSIGAGEGHEEYWFTQAGCVVTLNDIVSHTQPYLRSARKGQDRYVVADAREFLSKTDELFDAIYVSSFSPDEERRDQIQEEFKLCRSEHERYHQVTWPLGPEPYHPVLVAAFSRLRSGGLSIFQHYRGGVSLESNPHYIGAVTKQFQRCGVHVLELHHFRASSQNLLLTARKGSAFGARLRGKMLDFRPPITCFHGRYEDMSVSHDVVRLRPPLSKANVDGVRGESRSRSGSAGDVSRPVRRWPPASSP